MLLDSRLPERFWSKVVPTDSGCWEWSAGRGADGYGRFHVGPRRMALAHRVAFFALRGEVQIGLQLDHTCRNRRCVNPDHLEAVTPRENVLRGIAPSAANRRKSACKQGHSLSGENCREYRHKGRIHRVCRECARMESKRFRESKRERHLEYGRAYREAHRSELAAKQRAYIARKKEMNNG